MVCIKSGVKPNAGYLVPIKERARFQRWNRIRCVPSPPPTDIASKGQLQTIQSSLSLCMVAF